MAAADQDTRDEIAEFTRKSAVDGVARELRVYDVRPFAGGVALSEDEARELAFEVSTLIVELIEPESWAITGGHLGAVRTLPDAHLAVVHGADVQKRVKALIDALVAIHAAPITTITRQELPGGAKPISMIDVRALVSPDDSGQEYVDDLVNVLMESIAPESWAAVGGEVGLRHYGGTLLTNADVAQAEACRQFLETLRVVLASAEPSASRVVEAGERPLVVYDARSEMRRLGGDESEGASAIIERIVSSIDPEDWTMHGGDKATIRWLRPHLFVVRAPASTQQKVEAFFRELDRTASPAAEGASADGAAATSGASAGTPTPRFSAEVLNRLSARLDEGLFVIGLEALAAKEEASAQTKAADAAKVVDASGSDAARPAAAMGGADAMGMKEREPLRVIARFEKVDGELERALVKVGVEIEARAPGVGVLVLRVPRETLIDLALLHGVRRIEPLPTEVVAAP